MKMYIQPTSESWDEIIQRPVLDTTSLRNTVQAILDDVKIHGDAAIIKYSTKFDNYSSENIKVTETEMVEGLAQVSDELKLAIQQAAQNIEKFHRSQQIREQIVETTKGVECWRRQVPIEKVGLYIPGGSAVLFSTVLMLGIPAMVAGCGEIILCSPPGKNGKLHPAVLYAATLAGIDKIYKVGGAQAIAAMAFGTKKIEKLFKIFGPGNQYVTCAKQLVQLDNVAIDMPAGPSEVCVFADQTAEPAFVAADLLSQAEHGADSQVLLISTNEEIIKLVMKEIEIQLPNLPRQNIAHQALQNSKAIVLDNLQDSIKLINHYAPEHLILACSDAEIISDQITNAGSIFLGNFAPESVGDYASGTNHTLPTNGFAKVFSGVSVDSFTKKITYQRLTQAGLKAIGNTVIEMAVAEGLDGHANAVKIRLDSLLS